MKYTEKYFQNNHIISFFTNELKWEHGTSGEIDKNYWVVTSDIKKFLSNGKKSNRESFQSLLKKYESSDELVLDFIENALIPKILATSTNNCALILKQSISFKGYEFSLFNEPHIVGSSPETKEQFKNNIFKVINEPMFKTYCPEMQREIHRKPDLCFFVNGIYFGYSELKISTQGQSASDEGRKKIAHNIVESFTAAIEETLLESGHHISDISWSNISNNAQLYQSIIRKTLLFSRPVHITAIDDSQLFILNNATQFLSYIFEALKNDSSQCRIALQNTVPNKIIDSFEQMPALRNQILTQSVMSHLKTLYDPYKGIYIETKYFNNLKDKVVLRPRVAQRVMFSSVMDQVKSLYQNEFKTKLSSEQITNDIKHTIPNLSDKKTNDIISKAQKYKNGRDQHSILLQGAAGLGKTKLIVWLAYELVSWFHPESLEHNKTPCQLFDHVIILTDRVDLRENIAGEVVKNIAREASSTSNLVKAVNNNVPIIIYNIQKIIGLKKALPDDLRSKLKRKRVVFIIDEVHRTQNGEMNKDTMELFDACDDIETFNKNLIIGLTATPTEDILAKYGEFRTSSTPSDYNNWIPYFSYTLDQSIKSNYVLDPMDNIMTLTQVLDIKNVPEGKKYIDSTAIYSNPKRQKMVAEEVVKIFTNYTMNSIKPKNGMYSRYSEGKAMLVESSIENAIKMQALVKEELKRKSKQLEYKILEQKNQKTIDEIQHKIDAIEYISEKSVHLVFSDTPNKKASYFNNELKESDVLHHFRCENTKYKNSIVIVVDKLLTGFDEPTLHTLFINKNMKDIVLFQACCRINRTYPNKNEGLIVDMSHDNQIAKEIPYVFEKYGKISTSKFNGLTWEEKMENSYKNLFNDKEIKNQYNIWKNKKDDVLPQDLIEYADSFYYDHSSDKEKAVNIYKNCTQWLSIYHRMKNLIDFDDEKLKKHKDIKKQYFIQELKNLFYSRIKNNENKNDYIIFEINKFEKTYNNLDFNNENDIKKKNVNNNENLKNKNSSNIPSIDSIDIKNSLNHKEEKKQETINEIKRIMKKLFYFIKEFSKNDNNDSFSKKIRGEEYVPWEERMQHFEELYNKATSGKNKLSLKNETHLFDIDILYEKFYSRLSLLESDYEDWILEKLELD